MKKLLLFIESLSGGGAEKALVTLINNLDRDDYDITLLSLVDQGPFRDELDWRKIDYWAVIPNPTSLFAKLWGKVKYKLIYHLLPIHWVYKWIIPQSSFDLSIAFVEGFSTKLLAQAPGRKIAWVHTDLAMNPWPLKVGIYKDSKEEKEVYACFDKVVCVSNVVENALKKQYGLHNTITIYNIIDKSRILSLAHILPTNDLPKGFNIVAIGRLVQQKGFSKLIPIVARLRQRRQDVHLSIIGDGPDREPLKDLARECEAEAFVHLLGFQKNPYSLMRKADLLVSPSLAEGFGLVIAEAMVLEVPIIGMNSSGTSELLGNGEYGELCDTYDYLEKALSKAIWDSSFLKELKNKSAQGGKRFNPQSALQQVKTVLDGLCSPDKATDNHHY